jgi:hypothetical protein
MKVLLVSSGIGPWPNDGWGACENLTADFAWALESKGIDVKVFHDSDTIGKLPNMVREFRPDLVHIEYDDHVVAIIPVLREFPHLKILITTHYAYLSQPYKLIQDGYMFRFLLTSDLARLHNITLAVLSEEIANTYHILGGVPKEKLWVWPNGTRVDLLQFYKTPIYPSKAICVGKIETRKNQSLLQKCSSIDFIGPVSDESFQITEQYKGKWTRNELYEKIGQYGCLVLISQAEAHPLVIGEALGAGLAIVCNEISAANLPKEKPWIFVVSDFILKDPHELTKVVENACKFGLEYRSEIRQWAEEHLDYRKRAAQYCDKWNLSPSNEMRPTIRFITLNTIDSSIQTPSLHNLF